jgi:phosphonate metabolism protein PhnN/1,5-bisphosphokinase (PRPP-forming)
MPPLPGKLVLVVGPSGAGKDSLLRHAAEVLVQESHIVFPRRVIMRPSLDETEAHDTMTADEFRKARARGDFALSWDAHGLHYGIPASILRDLGRGRTVAVNAETAQRFPNMVILHVTAPVTVIAERLLQRGRETAEDIASRIAREPPHFEDRFETITIVNDTTLDAATETFTTALLQFAKEFDAAPV